MSSVDKANVITVEINGQKTNYPLTVKKLLEAATQYRQSAWTPADTLVIHGDVKIELCDIFELNMPGRLALAKLIFDDLFIEEEAA